MFFLSSGVHYHMTCIDYEMHCLVDFWYLVGINSKSALIAVVIAGVSVTQPIGHFSCFLNQLDKSSKKKKITVKKKGRKVKFSDG